MKTDFVGSIVFTITKKSLYDLKCCFSSPGMTDKTFQLVRGIFSFHIEILLMGELKGRRWKYEN